MAKYNQGIFKPKNPEKYKGNVNNIIYRSGWELKMLVKLDNHPDVTQYSSEEIIIPYISPLDNKYHRYFMDFYVRYTDKDNNVKEMLIEVKPAKQTKPPVKTKNKKKKTLIQETLTYAVNQAKWEAAKKYCKKRNWEFHIFSEKDLGI